MWAIGELKKWAEFSLWPVAKERLTNGDLQERRQWNKRISVDGFPHGMGGHRFFSYLSQF